MANYYQDFVGLNTFVYDISDWDNLTVEEIDYNNTKTSGLPLGLNTIGIKDPATQKIAITSFYLNYVFTKPNLPSFAVADNPDVFNALMIKRNGPYGYPSWQQIRVGNNPLTRKQRANNIFTYVQEPGNKYEITINQKNYSHIDRFGAINKFTEPVVVDSYKPLELIGGLNVYNPKIDAYETKMVKIKTSFANETAFFANDQVNRYYETIEESDQNYEKLKELYLNGGLLDDSSPLEIFNLLTYKQSIWPKQQYRYLNKTRSRTFFVNKFWRDVRTDRTNTSVDNGFGSTVPSQSMWPLDIAADWSTRGIPSQSTNGSAADIYGYYIGAVLGGLAITNILGFNTGEDSGVPTRASSSLGGAGVLMNSYSHVGRGYYTSTGTPTYGASPKIIPEGGSPGPSGLNLDNLLSASCFYAKRHTINLQESVVSPSGMNLSEVTRSNSIATGSLFEGLATWDAPVQAGKNPFYDSYEDFAQNIRLKGQGYSIVPEFRISSHVETYETLGITEELSSIFEISGALKSNTTTSNSSTFYEVLSTSDFLKHFDLIKKDHEDFTSPSVLTLKCKAVKKFLPYEGFYPANRTTQIAQQFYSSHKDAISAFSIGGNPTTGSSNYANQVVLEPLFAPGVLFNTIKSGVACDYPVIFDADNVATASYDYAKGTGSDKINYVITGSDLSLSSSGYYDSIFSTRIPFEALVEPERYMANKDFSIQEPHPFGIGGEGVTAIWSGDGDNLYKKMANNFLAEVPEFFLKSQNFTTLSSLESSNPEFGNAISGNYYVMRVKMYHSRDKANDQLPALNDEFIQPPQDLYPRREVRETFTMYSRPTAFGSSTWGGGTGSYTYDSIDYNFSGSDSLSGFNFPYTAPYYHGEGWCDLIFKPTETKKYTLSEILTDVQKFPYYTRFWWPGENDAIRDLAGVAALKASSNGYTGSYDSYDQSPWVELPASTGSALPPALYYTTTNWSNTPTSDIRPLRNDTYYGPQHPSVLNYNAMQLKSSVNLFGKAQSISKRLTTDGSETNIEVFSEGTTEAKSQWVIQPKFETPMLNFNKYTNLDENSCTKPLYASESVARGMWHQYGELPAQNEGVYLQVDDIPQPWLAGALNVDKVELKNKVRSLADLCGFDKNPVKLGQVGEVKQISEAVVAVPFIEKGATRQFFTIPRADIDDTLSALQREVEPGSYVLGGPPKVGNTIIDMVKKMQRYVFPPSMDFVRYNQIQPFAMYVFEFTHNLSKKDLADIWQNLPPDIGTSFDEAEASISHELLAHELLGGGSVIKDGKLDENAEGNELPSSIQWMVFKVKRRAQTKYFDKVVQNTGRLPKPALQLAAERDEDKDKRAQGEDPDITYNWPYDFFSLVELVKLDAEVTLANVENDDKGNKVFKEINKKDTTSDAGGKRSQAISEARGNKKDGK